LVPRPRLSSAFFLRLTCRQQFNEESKSMSSRRSTACMATPKLGGDGFATSFIAGRKRKPDLNEVLCRPEFPRRITHEIRHQRMSAFGPKRTSACAMHMSAFRGKADMTYCSAYVSL